MAFPTDPYPDIPPALLNSADLRAYAENPATAFIQPFNPAFLKSASYEIPFEGAVHYWEPGKLGNLVKREHALTGATQFNIRPNSIVFVSPVVKFKLPDYLAIRFNLSISRVHQGLLLGTGPLVDPGFEGQLLIPLHNLTNQDIVIHPDDGFIWVEVTKLSPYPPANSIHNYPYVSFPPLKKNLLASQYFRKSTQGKAVTSSVQATLDEMRLTQTRTQALLGFGAVATVIGLATLLLAAFQLYSLVQTANGRYDAVTSDNLLLKRSIEELTRTVERQQLQLERLTARASAEVVTLPKGKSGQIANRRPAE